MSNSRSEGQPSEKWLGRGSADASAGSASDRPHLISEPSAERPAESSPGPTEHFLVWVDQDARLEYGDADARLALGYSPGDLSSLRVWDICPMTEDSWPARWAYIKQHRERTVWVEMRTLSGGTLPVRLQMKYATVGGKEFLLCNGRSLHRRKVVPSATVVEFTGDAIFVLDDGRVADSTRKGHELFGASREQIVAELENIIRETPSLRDRTARALQGQEVTFQWHSQRPDGSRFHIECTLFRVAIEGHVRLLAVAVDATARGKSEHTLAQLSSRLLEMQDQERRRIARELHDTTGQNLAALSINLSMILTTCALDANARETLEECIALTDSSVKEIRTLSYLLHPPLLDELGLVSALHAYAAGYAERTGLEIELDLPDRLPRLPQGIEIALFRIVQEGLTNIHRHSGSSTAILRLKYQPKGVELEIADHGRGLPPGTLEGEMTSASRIGVGIAGMRERARQLGGRLTIGSSETGTTLHVVLPLTPEIAPA